MPTVDELKRERDGHLSYGEKVRWWRRGWAPKVTQVGYDAEGQAVSLCRSFGPGFGELVYGDSRSVERWERTEAGERLYGRDPDG